MWGWLGWNLFYLAWILVGVVIIRSQVRKRRERDEERDLRHRIADALEQQAKRPTSPAGPSRPATRRTAAGARSRRKLR